MKQHKDLITVQDKLEDSLVLYDTQHKVLIGTMITIGILVVAIVMMLFAYWQRRKTIRQRQAMNEEQTLFYTDPSSRYMRFS